MANEDDSICDSEVNFTTRKEAYSLLVDDDDRFVTYVVYPCIMVLGVITNGAFCIVITRVARMRNITNLYLVNLAVADLTFLIIAVSEKLARITASPVHSDKTLYGLTGCILVPFILNCTYFASIFIVTLVSVEKFCAVCRPLQHRRVCSMKRSVKLLIGAWVLSLMCSGTFIPGRARLDIVCFHWPVDLDDIDLPSTVTYCKPIKVWSWFQHVANFLQTVPFFVASAANMFMYIKILKTMHRRVHAQEQLNEINNKIVQVRNQVATMLVANGLVFFLCQVLFQGVSIALAFRHLKAVPTLTVVQIDKVLLVARALSYLNSAVNAIVYNVFSSRYRRAFRETFSCWKARVHPVSNVSHIKINPGIVHSGEQVASGPSELTPQQELQL